MTILPGPNGDYFTGSQGKNSFWTLTETGDRLASIVKSAFG